MGDASETARWRHERLTNNEFLLRQPANGKPISPIFEAPFVSKDVIRRDWLHMCDHGVGQDFAANVLKTLSRVMPAGNHKQRVQLLFERIEKWYDDNHVTDRIHHLTPSAIQKSGKGPTLNASAVCVRALYPFLKEASNALLDASKPEDRAVQIACDQLNRCKDCLSGDSDVLWSDILRESSKKFALQFQALRMTAEGKDWKVKPKMHHFLEMCADGQKPSMSWTYRDEDYGGSIAKMSRRRGGKKSAKSWSAQTMTLFCIHNPVPRLV